MTIFLLLRVVYGACLLVTGYVGWRFGGVSERWGVLIIVTASLATMAVMTPVIFDWKTHRSGLVAVDLATLAAFLVLALRSRRFWPIWATAFHLIAVCSHGAVLILSGRLLQTYAFFQGFWAYPIMICILIGVRSHRRELHTIAD